MSIPTTASERKALAAFPYFESHNFEGWKRQFRTLVESKGDTTVSFDTEPTAPVDAGGSPIALNAAA